MPSTKKEYICSYCGARQTTFDSAGRPAPGTCGRRGKTKDGRMYPHTWRISKTNAAFTNKTNQKVEYMCSYCGTRITSFLSNGRPAPGTCPRKGKTPDGKMKPHSWRISKKY